MEKRKHNSVLILAGVFLILLVSQKYFYLLNLILKNLVDIFAIGRSVIKMELFLFYTILLCFIAVSPKVRRTLGAWKVRTSWLLFSIGATFLCGLMLIFVYFQQWGFGIRDFVVTFHNNEISSTVLTHNHLMKSINALFLGWFGAAQQENLDTGFAFIGLLPSILYWIGAIFFIISVALLLIKFVELYEKQIKRPVIFIVIYSIVSFCLLKNMIDGGILNYETPIALSALCLILLIYHNKTKEKLFYLWSLLPLAIYAFSVYILLRENFISKASIFEMIYDMIAFSVVMTTMLFWQFEADRKMKLGILFLILSGLLLYIPVSSAIGTYTNSRRIINEKGAIVALYNPPNYVHGTSADWNEIEKINDMTIYEVRPNQPTKINEILLNNNLLANLLPITLPDVNCKQNKAPDLIDFTLTTPDELQEDITQYKFGHFVEISPAGKTNSLYRYNVTVLLDPCAPRPLIIIQELLKLRGLETFFLTNISNPYVAID